MGWVFSTNPRPLHSQANQVTHPTEVWVGYCAGMDGLDGHGNHRLHRDSKPRQSSSYRLPIMTELPQLPYCFSALLKLTYKLSIFFDIYYHPAIINL